MVAAVRATGAATAAGARAERAAEDSAKVPVVMAAEAVEAAMAQAVVEAAYPER